MSEPCPHFAEFLGSKFLRIFKSLPTSDRQKLEIHKPERSGPKGEGVKTRRRVKSPGGAPVPFRFNETLTWSFALAKKCSKFQRVFKSLPNLGKGARVGNTR